jgi:hypothetical protein
MATFSDDLEAAASLGWGVDDFDEMAEIGFTPGDLATFMNLESEHRKLVLRLLDDDQDVRLAAWDEVGMLPQPFQQNLARWVAALPAYRNARDDEDKG